jgi:diguanylate cyclase (GGDEF)-like protein/PAS domain S-box-containing protein
VAILRVLLLEAGQRNGQRLLAALRGGGHVIDARQLARTVELEAALADEHWDVVLLSCTLPDLAPAAAIALLRRLAPGVPVVLLVERGSQEFPLELLDSGACDFVFKSNPSRLLAVIERECARAVGGRQADGEPAGPLAEGEARFFQLASNIPECYWLIDADSQRVTYVSEAYEQIWGRHVEALYANRLDWLNYVHPDDRERVFDALRRHRCGGLNIRLRVLRPGDSLRWLHVRNFPVHDESGRVVSVGGVASDISSLLGEPRQVAFFAHFDTLTALPNQLMFYDQVRRQLALARRDARRLGLMVIDIDRFREVNQALGHVSGDELLRQVAGRLSGSLRESDSLGRLGGDVFAVLLPEIGTAQQAGIVARRLIETLITPLRVDGQDVFATASLGIAFFPDDGKDAHELVSAAQIAMRHAKSEGRNNYQCFSAGMQNDIRQRLRLETDLRNATLRDEFVLHYQAKASCASGRITGAEALIRWQHPQRGLVAPDQFIPLLEETGLIVPVGRWVLETACRQAVEWRAAGLDLPSVSVNLSARQLQSETLLDDVAATLLQTGLPAACLDLEITESMLMHNAESAIALLTGLKQMGVSISLDDFGTGYSSLAYLKRFPIDAVKVDRSFVRDITADSDDASITRAVITMAHHLKLKVVAEGVETAEQLALLISHQCDIVQGYFFSRPLPAPEMMQLLATDQRLPSSLLRSGARQPLALFVGVKDFDAATAMLVRDGLQVVSVADYAAAQPWLAGNAVDVLVCGSPHPGFDAAAIIGQAAALRPLCERILLADSRQWNRKLVAELSGSGMVHRVIHLPVDVVAFRDTVAEAMSRRHIADEYQRLSHAVDTAERELLRVKEERRRLEAENQALHECEGQGYRLLQDVVGELPWPVLCTDDKGMLALVNDAALQRFAGRGLAPGCEIAELLPEVRALGDGDPVSIDGRRYRCRSRKVLLGGTMSGRMLLLEEESHESD